MIQIHNHELLSKVFQRSDLLTQEEITELTGSVQSNKQASILADHGIFYVRRRDGLIMTTWHHVNHPCRLHLQNDAEPDFSSLA